MKFSVIITAFALISSTVTALTPPDEGDDIPTPITADPCPKFCEEVCRDDKQCLSVCQKNCEAALSGKRKHFVSRFQSSNVQIPFIFSALA